MKTHSTSLSRPRDLSLRETPKRNRTLNIETCPECGQKSIKLVVSDHRTEMGFLIPDLERFHCSSCGAEFFDTAAMTRIMKEGTLAAKPSRRIASKRVLEPNNA